MRDVNKTTHCSEKINTPESSSIGKKYLPIAWSIQRADDAIWVHLEFSLLLSWPSWLPTEKEKAESLTSLRSPHVAFRSKGTREEPDTGITSEVSPKCNFAPENNKAEHQSGRILSSDVSGQLLYIFLTSSNIISFLITSCHFYAASFGLQGSSNCLLQSLVLVAIINPISLSNLNHLSLSPISFIPTIARL